MIVTRQHYNYYWQLLNTYYQMSKQNVRSNYSRIRINQESKKYSGDPENYQGVKDVPISDQPAQQFSRMDQIQQLNTEQKQTEIPLKHSQLQKPVILLSETEENIRSKIPHQQVKCDEDRQTKEESLLINIEALFSRLSSFSQQVKQTHQIISLKHDLQRKQQQLFTLRKTYQQTLQIIQNQRKSNIDFGAKIKQLALQNKKLTDQYDKNIGKLRDKQMEIYTTLKGNLQLQVEQLKKQQLLYQSTLKNTYEQKCAALEKTIKNKQLIINSRLESESKLSQRITQLQKQNQRLKQLSQRLQISQQKYRQLHNKAESKWKNQYQTLYEEKIRSLNQSIQQIKNGYKEKSLQLYNDYQKYKIKQKQMKNNEILTVKSDYQIRLKNLSNQSKRQLQTKQKQLTDLRSSKQNQLRKITSQINKFKEQNSSLQKYQTAGQQIKKIIRLSKLIQPQNACDITKLSSNVARIIQSYKNIAASAEASQKNIGIYLSSLQNTNEKNIQYLNKLVTILQNTKIFQNSLEFGQFPQEKENKNNEKMEIILKKLAKQIKRCNSFYKDQLQTKKIQIEKKEQQFQKLRKQHDIKIQSSEDLKQKFYNLNQNLLNLQLTAENLKLSEQQLIKKIAQLNSETQTLRNLLKTKQEQIANSQSSHQLKIQQNLTYIEGLQSRISQLSQQLKQTNANLTIQKDLNAKLIDKQSISASKLLTLQKNNQLKQKQKQHECKKMKDQFANKQILLKNTFDQTTLQMNQKICKTIQKVYGNQPPKSDVDSIISFISQNALSSNNTAFTVSHILEKMPKERSILYKQCCQFLSANSISTKLTYKYDENCRNFSFYLPSVIVKFAFVVLFKSKKQNVFGFISYSLGRDSKSMAFNLNSLKFMGKMQNTRAPSTTFQNNYLKFGNQEVIIKNNTSPEIKVNTVILGQRYFEFSKQDLVASDEADDLIALQAMEIHKINTV